MLREDRELLADLSRACSHAPQFALEFMAGNLSVDTEEAYALLLGDIADRLLLHAKGRKGLVLDGEPTQLVIDAPGVVVDWEGRELVAGEVDIELPPGHEPGSPRV